MSDLKTVDKNNKLTNNTGNRHFALAEFTWSDKPCANGHIGWRRITLGTSRGVQYRHSKCEQCRKDTRNRHRHKDVAMKFRTKINGSIKARLANRPRRKKQTDADILLGCSVEHYIQYIKSTWNAGMTWENWGTYWQIDHIQPCHTFDLTNPEHISRCFHYTNTRPLLVTQNTWSGK